MSSFRRPIVSVIVSTYNRASLLPKCLHSLSQQSATKSQFEVIIVNNNSTDTTQDIIDTFTTKYKNFFSYFEPTAGISLARNKGARQARGVYLAFFDDDAIASKNWVKNSISIIKSRYPAILGGPVYPYYLHSKPKWFKNQYATLSNGSRPKILKSNQFLFGSNIFISHSLFNRHHGFDPQLGVTGNQPGFGEETAFIRKARAANPKLSVYYHPQLKIKHLVSSKKNSLLHHAKSTIIYGLSAPLIDRDQFAYLSLYRLFLKLIQVNFLMLFNLLITLVIPCTQRYPYPANRIREKIIPHLYWLGVAFTLIKSKVKSH